MAVALTTLPLRTVIRTCTGPYWVSIASPVTVFIAACGPEGEPLPPDDRADDGLDEVPVADRVEPIEPAEAPPAPEVPAAAGGVATEAGWVLKDNRPTRPATVVNRARATRRIKRIPLELEGFGMDLPAGDPRLPQRRHHGSRHSVRPADIHVVVPEIGNVREKRRRGKRIVAQPRAAAEDEVEQRPARGREGRQLLAEDDVGVPARAVDEPELARCAG